jgi:hypothetical protein
MTQMSTGQARVIDPILTTVARGYKNTAMIGGFLFPYVPVGQRGGKIIEFGKEAMRLYQTQRAPGSNTKRIQVGYLGAPFALESHSLEGLVPKELNDEAAAVPGIDLAAGSIVTVQDTIALRLEYAQAQLARNASAYGADNTKSLSSKARWDDVATTSDPVAEIMAYKEVIRSQTGMSPTTIVMGKKVSNALRVHPKIIARITVKTTPETPVVADADLMRLFDIKQIVVGESVYWDDAAGKFVDIWGGDLVMACTEMGSVADRGRPTYGYTYRLKGYPIVEPGYEDRSAKSWVYPVTDEVQPVIAMPSAGFLLKNAVTA